MDFLDRIYRLHAILRSARYPVPHARLKSELDCSRATVNRIIERLRDGLGAPIEYDRRYNGYRYTPLNNGPYELPGLWFNASELYALLTTHQLLANASTGLMDEVFEPLRERIEKLLTGRHLPKGEIGRRVRILRMAARQVEPAHFKVIANAVLARKRLRLVYHGRTRDETTEREISPQRLAHYRDNWYLDAWDHGRKALRSFAIDRIRQAKTVNKLAKEISDARLDSHFASAYGIFAGKPKHKAVLRFSPESARWVADEIWHPQQKSRFDGGYYVLEVPYSDPRELVMDILKYGPDVEVVLPVSLRRAVLDRLDRALAQYRRPSRRGKKGGRKRTYSRIQESPLGNPGSLYEPHTVLNVADVRRVR